MRYQVVSLCLLMTAVGCHGDGRRSERSGVTNVAHYQPGAGNGRRGYWNGQRGGQWGCPHRCVQPRCVQPPCVPRKSPFPNEPKPPLPAAQKPKPVPVRVAKPAPRPRKVIQEIKHPRKSNFGHARDFSWMVGQLRHVHVNGGSWKLRYAPLDVQDQWGGSVILAQDARIDRFRDGDFVYVEGEILATRPTVYLAGPLYRISKIRKLTAADARKAWASRLQKTTIRK